MHFFDPIFRFEYTRNKTKKKKNTEIQSSSQVYIRKLQS